VEILINTVKPNIIEEEEEDEEEDTVEGKGNRK
jgi:hypothetical protein